MQSEPIKIAILGVGRWGVNFVRNFLAHPETQIVAIVDPNPDNLEQCREKFQSAADSILWAQHWEEVRSSCPLDAVVVVTPASTHYSLIADALGRGYHVLSEKPLTLDHLECLELSRLAASKQKILLVDHTYLFHPAVQRGQEIIASGELGRKFYGYSSRTHLGPVRQDVDALWDLAIHDLVIFNNWLGESPATVQAVGSNWLQPGLSDLVWLNLTYPSGFSASIHLCWSNPDKQRRLCVVNEQGTLIFDEMSTASPLTVQRGYLEKSGSLFLPQKQKTETIAVEKAEPLQAVCQAFVRAIRNPATAVVSSGWLASQLVQVLQCLSASIQAQGKIISVPLLEETSDIS